MYYISKVPQDWSFLLKPNTKPKPKRKPQPQQFFRGSFEKNQRETKLYKERKEKKENK